MLTSLTHLSSALLGRAHRTGETPQHYLFLLSHMRSYSSLLAHLLGSSPEIDGCGESHVRYKRAIDLWRLRREVQRTIGTPASGRFLLDKILHNHIRSPDKLIAPEQVRAVIFLRQPEATLRSIVTLARIQCPNDDIANPQFACDYYVSRLHRLRADGLRLGQRALYFDAECLNRSPQPLLDKLTRWLQLDTPLSSEYQLSRRTGENLFGDPLPNIRAGRILDPSSSTIANDVQIPAMLLQEAEAAYSRCRSALLDHCETGALHAQH